MTDKHLTWAKVEELRSSQGSHLVSRIVHSYHTFKASLFWPPHVMISSLYSYRKRQVYSVSEVQPAWSVGSSTLGKAQDAYSPPKWNSSRSKGANGTPSQAFASSVPGHHSIYLGGQHTLAFYTNCKRGMGCCSVLTYHLTKSNKTAPLPLHVGFRTQHLVLQGNTKVVIFKGHCIFVPLIDHTRIHFYIV